MKRIEARFKASCPQAPIALEISDIMGWPVELLLTMENARELKKEIKKAIKDAESKGL